MKRPAFTLLELLVVIAVIALLVTLTAPAARKAKEVAYEKVCSANLRQGGLVLMAYAGNNREYFPLEPTEHNDPFNPTITNPDDRSHRSLLLKLNAYEEDGLMEAFYCPKANSLEPSAQSLTSVPAGDSDSVIDTPENRMLGNITYIYWSFAKNKVYPVTGQSWREKNIFIPRQLTLTGAIPVSSGQYVRRVNSSQRWVMSDFFRKQAPFPHGRKGGVEGGLNVVCLDGHVELLRGRPQDNYR